MATTVDNLVALYVLKMLVTPFTNTKAFKLGIIDARGKNLIPTEKFTKPEQHNAYNYLTRFVFNLKRLLARLPGGDNMLKSFVAALLLLKENKNENDQVNEFKLNKIMTMLDEGVLFVEETLLAKKLINEEMVSGNIGITGIPISTGSVGGLGVPMITPGRAPTNKIGPTGKQLGLDRPIGPKSILNKMARRSSIQHKKKQNQSEEVML